MVEDWGSREPIVTFWNIGEPVVKLMFYWTIIQIQNAISSISDNTPILVEDLFFFFFAHNLKL